jgi:hypothetical protein
MNAGVVEDLECKEAARFRTLGLRPCVRLNRPVDTPTVSGLRF